MLGEFLASSVSNPGFSWICSPACTELEQVVLDWCAKMFGLEDGWLLSSGIGGGIIIVSLSCPVTSNSCRTRLGGIRHVGRADDMFRNPLRLLV